MLTAALIAVIASDRAREGCDESSLVVIDICLEGPISLTRMLQLPGLQHAHPDDRAGAVFRAPGHSLQRIPSYPRPARAGAYGRSRHVPVRTRRLAARSAGDPLRAPAADDRHRHRPLVEKAAA